MRGTLKLIIGLLLIFGTIGFVIIFSYSRLNTAFDLKLETDARNSNIANEVSRSQWKNKADCNPREEDAENQALCVVETRTKSSKTLMKLYYGKIKMHLIMRAYLLKV